MDKLPDLPGLESAYAKTGEGCNPLPGCALLVFAPVWGVIVGARWYSVAGLMLLVIGSALLYYYLTDRTIQIDSTGIASRKRIAATSIAWSEVASAATAEKNGCQTLVIESKAGHMITVPVSTYCDALLEAAIWQYLRRAGKTGNVRLSDDALSLWCEIPENVPVEMELGPESQPKGEGHHRYSITSDHVAEFPNNAMDPLRHPTLTAWSEVTNVWWESENHDQEIWLYIDSGERETLIPLKKDDTEAARLFLAVVRKARAIPDAKPIVIPKEYRQLCVLPE